MAGGELRVPDGDILGVQRRVQLGELRIPSRDIDDMAKRGRLIKPGKPQEQLEVAA